MKDDGSTKTDPSARDTALDDDVLQLRVWGSSVIHKLPTAADDDWLIGSTEECWLQLHDPKGRVSRRHAVLIRDGERWMIRDLDSKNGIKVADVRSTEVRLQPGLEIWIGGVTLVAESARSISVRAFLARILGWSAASAQTIEVALRALRAMGFSTRFSGWILASDARGRGECLSSRA